MKKLLADHPQPYMVFAEDREHPIRMDERCRCGGSAAGRSASCMPSGAERVLCLSDRRLRGGKALDGIALEFTDLRSPQWPGSFRPRGLSCINLSGNDYLGQPFHPAVSVPQGKVQALWCGWTSRTTPRRASTKAS